MYEGETEPIPRVSDPVRPQRDRGELHRPDGPADTGHGQEGPGHGHGHGHGHTPAEPASRRVRTIIAVLLVPFALAAVVGAVLLYPFGGGDETRAGAGTPVQGVITAASTGSCSGDVQAGDQGGSGCLLATVRMTDGEAPDREIQLVIPLEPATPRFAVEDEVVLSYGGGDPTDGQSYQLVDFQREVPLALLAALFAVAVLVLGRWQGLKALGALVISFLVLVFFVLPAIIAGESPLLVAIAGAGVIMFVVLYLTHGLSARTSTAVLGTMVSLALIGVLGALWAAFAKLTGLDEETATLVGLLDRPIDTRGLLLAGVVIGALGVLDDVTVTQTSAVWELRAANPSLTRRQLYASALRIGRDHVASAVNTLVMAYAGAALPLLLYSSISGVGIGNILTSQSVAQEIVRTLVGSIGIVAAVPVTTALAAAVASQEKPPGLGVVEAAPAPRKRPAGRRDDGGPRPRSEDRAAAGRRQAGDRRAVDRSPGRGRPDGRERSADRTPGQAGRERSVERAPGQDRTAGRERAPDHDRTAGRERAPGQDGTLGRERTVRRPPGQGRAAGREQSPEQDRLGGRERADVREPAPRPDRSAGSTGSEQVGEPDRPRSGRRRLAEYE